MNVIILIQSMNALGGTEIVASNLCNAFNDVGHIQCGILTIEPYSGNNQHVKSLNLKPTVSNIKNWIRKNHTAAVINFSHENIPLLAACKDEVKSIAVFHWSIRGYENSVMKLARNKRWPLNLLAVTIQQRKYKKVHQAMSHLDALIALTNTGATEIVEEGGNDTHVTVIPNFLPYDRAASKISTLNNGIVIFVGRLSKEKGVFHLLKIWERLSQLQPKLKLYIYGEGHERQAMENIISERKLQNIFFMGFEQDAQKIYSNADLLLCPSETEGFGMVLIEAMHYGVIPIAFDCPVSPRELIDNAGLTVECFNTESFGQIASDLLNDRDRMHGIQKNCLKRASQFYKHNVIEQWHRLLEKNI